jgi:hypothetical protein
MVMLKNLKQNSFKIFIFSCTIYLSNVLVAQEKESMKYGVEISTDNDAIGIWKNLDRYYSFGIGVKFYVKSKKFIGLENLFSNKEQYFFDIELRSEGYTPTRKSYTISEVQNDSLEFERPFAGLLFGTLGATYTFDRSFIRTELILGIMGPSAKTEEIQNWFHSQLEDSDEIEGWEFQIPDQALINLNVSGVYDFYPNSQVFDVFAMAEARLGNLYIDATPTLGIRLGKFGDISQSSAFKNDILASINMREIYLKSTISGTLTAFNGTAQGNLFGPEFKYAVKDLSHFHTTLSNGLYIATKRFIFSFENIFTFNKVNKRTTHIFGKATVRYKF